MRGQRSKVSLPGEALHADVHVRDGDDETVAVTQALVDTCGECRAQVPQDEHLVEVCVGRGWRGEVHDGV